MSKASHEQRKKRQKKEKNKLKTLRRKAENIKKRQAENETFKLEDEVRRIQNRGLSIRNPKEKNEI
ncbi:uncharacterized protein METZ01_LOCUS173755 [marine metagenome]|uniref:Uncharacterized protein n=1 Tax=marine metagenome TaxID=408172 RepID=A0A382C5C4_9ZZZZ